MGFSFKLAPGIRIRASSRGLRASVGPRAARVHFGSGRTGVSSGFGPVGFYTALGGGRRGGSRSTAGGRPRGVASYQRQLAQSTASYGALPAESAKTQEARRLNELISKVLNLHREHFHPAQRPVAPAPAPPDRSVIYQATLTQTMAGVGLFNFSRRKQARQQAVALTDKAVSAERQRRVAEQQHYQRQLDDWWNRLCSNDPDVVMYILDQAFEDNEAPAAPVGVNGVEASLVVLAPDISTIPERRPGTTDAGNLSLRKMTKGARASLYTLTVCGHLLLTVREAFAVAPGIQVVRAAVLQNQGRDAFGQPRVACLLAASFDRSTLDRVQWDTADAVEVVNSASTDRVLNQRGQAKELHPVSLESEPELAALIKAVDLNELMDN